MNIHCENLRLSYGENTIVKDLNIQFKPHSINVIIGPSGSGKSTILRSIAALEDPADGIIYYNDKSHQELCPRAIRENVGLIFQKPTLFEGTVYENLIFGLVQQKKIIDRKNIEETLSQLGIPIHYLEKKGNELSLGEQQRICIIRALLPSPALFLLDEPTSALDPQTSKRVVNLILKLKTDFNKTVIMVSHDIKESLEIADYIYFLSEGGIAFQGTVAELEKQKLQDAGNNLITRFLKGDYE